MRKQEFKRSENSFSVECPMYCSLAYSIPNTDRYRIMQWNFKDFSSKVIVNVCFGLFDCRNVND